MQETIEQQEEAIWNGLIGYTRGNDATPEMIISQAPTFPRHMLGSACRIDEAHYLRIAHSFIGSEDYTNAKEAAQHAWW